MDKLNDIETELQFLESDRLYNQGLLELKRRNQQNQLHSLSGACNQIPNLVFAGKVGSLACMYLDTQSIKRNANGTVSGLKYLISDGGWSYPVNHWHMSVLLEVNCRQKTFKNIKGYYWTQDFRLIQTRGYEEGPKALKNTFNEMIGDLLCR